MKKIQLVFAVLAFLVAGAGVFASTLQSTVYYRSTDPLPMGVGANCDEQLTGYNPTCPDLNGDQCTDKITVDKVEDTYYISKIEDPLDPDCVEVLKD